MVFPCNQLAEYIVYEENMNKISPFSPETLEKKEDSIKNMILRNLVHYEIGYGKMTLFIVRENDSYICRHHNMSGLLNDDEYASGMRVIFRIELEDPFGASE